MILFSFSALAMWWEKWCDPGDMKEQVSISSILDPIDNEISVLETKKQIRVY